MPSVVEIIESVTVDGPLESGHEFKELVLHVDLWEIIHGKEIKIEFGFPVIKPHEMVDELVRR